MELGDFDGGSLKNGTFDKVNKDGQVPVLHEFQMALAFLREFGLEAETAGDGAIARRILESQSFDLILMDCQMSTMDGFEATREIRKLADRAKAADSP